MIVNFRNRFRTLFIFGLLAGVSLGGCASKPPFPPATPEAVINVSNLISPAVVRIDVAQEVYVDGKRTLHRGIGSGVIIDQLGRVLTNFHVAGRSVELYVTLSSKDRIPAKLIGDDHWTDLAIIQMDMEELARKKVQFSSAKLGRSDNLLTGQDVMAIGTPFGLNRTVTLGQISNNERHFLSRPNDYRPDSGRKSGDRGFFQLDSDGYAHQPRQQRGAIGGS